MLFIPVEYWRKFLEFLKSNSMLQLSKETFIRHTCEKLQYILLTTFVESMELVLLHATVNIARRMQQATALLLVVAPVACHKVACYMLPPVEPVE